MLLTNACLLFGSFSSTVAKSSLACTYLVKPLLATARLRTAVHSSKQYTITEYLIYEKKFALTQYSIIQNKLALVIQQFALYHISH